LTGRYFRAGLSCLIPSPTPAAKVNGCGPSGPGKTRPEGALILQCPGWLGVQLCPPIPAGYLQTTFPRPHPMQTGFTDLAEQRSGFVPRDVALEPTSSASALGSASLTYSEIFHFAPGFHCRNQPAGQLSPARPSLGRHLGIAILWKDSRIFASYFSALAEQRSITPILNRIPASVKDG